MRFLGWILAGLVLVLPTSRALACSVTSEFVRATNYELADGADAVVVAVADSGVPGDGFSGSVTFRIQESWKGAPPASVIMNGARLGRIEPSDPNSINTAHPESFAGPCSRQTFQRGRKYVLFLHNDDGNWRPREAVFGRSSEDYAGPNSLWERTLRLYLEVQRNPDRMAALGDLGNRLAALEAPGSSAADRAIAADIRDHLGSLSPLKPTAYLLDAYAALERGESPRFSIRGPEANREGGAADALTDMIFDVRHPEFDIARQKEWVLLSLVNGDHPEAEPLFARLVAGQPTAGELGLAMRFESNQGHTLRAFELIRSRALSRLGGLPDQEASRLAGNMVTAMRGPDYRYNENNEAWRSEPLVREQWPEVALSLWWDMRRRDVEMVGDSAIESLRPADYRDRPEVTLALAAQYDDAVESWAIAETARLAPLANWLKDEDPVWLPIRVLVVAYGEERDAALASAVCASESGRTIVLRSLAVFGDEMDIDLIARILAMPGQTDDEVEQVRRALAISYGRSVSEPSRRWFGMGSSAYEALQASFRGERDADVRPLTCGPTP